MSQTPGLEDALWRLLLLAGGMPEKLAEQLGIVGNAINQGATDAVAADHVDMETA